MPPLPSPSIEMMWSFICLLDNKPARLLLTSFVESISHNLRFLTLSSQQSGTATALTMRTPSIKECYRMERTIACTNAEVKQ